MHSIILLITKRFYQRTLGDFMNPAKKKFLYLNSFVESLCCIQWYIGSRVFDKFAALIDIIRVTEFCGTHRDRVLSMFTHKFCTKFFLNIFSVEYDLLYNIMHCIVLIALFFVFRGRQLNRRPSVFQFRSLECAPK